LAPGTVDNGGSGGGLSSVAGALEAHRGTLVRHGVVPRPLSPVKGHVLATAT
jgi:hypothetical protein